MSDGLYDAFNGNCWPLKTIGRQKMKTKHKYIHVERLARKVATTGNIEDLGRYLKARRELL